MTDNLAALFHNLYQRGMSDGTLNPGGASTRAQVATMLMRFNGMRK